MAAPDETLEALAVRAAAGDRLALRAIWDRTAQPLVREVIGPVLPWGPACEDALKETFLTVIDKLPSLASGEVYPWLATIARNKALDRRRRMSSEGRFLRALAEELALADRAVPDPESLVSLQESRRRTRERVEAVLARMNPRYAQAVRLRLLEDTDREQCAARLALRLGTFDVLFFRACKQFRERYVELYGAKGGGAT